MELFIKFLILFGILISILSHRICYGSGESWGAYSIAPQGNRRVTGMGGAFVGLSDDVNGILYNFSGYAFSDNKYAIGGNYNRVTNSEVSVSNDGNYVGIPYGYLQFAGSTQVDDWSFGLGIDSPYSAQASYSTIDNSNFLESITIGLSILKLDLAAAYRINENFSAGLTFGIAQVNENYSYSSANSQPKYPAVSLSTGSWTLLVNLGFSYRKSKDFGLGFDISSGSHVPINTSLNLLSGDVWFRDVIIPAKATLGTFYRILPHLLLVGDLDLFPPPGLAAYIGSEVAAGFGQVLLDDKFKFLPHGGIEWQAVESKTWDLFLRTGTYIEPPRVNGGLVRAHVTAGADVRIWVLIPGAAIDYAVNYLNYTVGIGFSIKNL